MRPDRFQSAGQHLRVFSISATERRRSSGTERRDPKPLPSPLLGPKHSAMSYGLWRQSTAAGLQQALQTPSVQPIEGSMRAKASECLTVIPCCRR